MPAHKLLSNVQGSLLLQVEESQFKTPESLIKRCECYFRNKDCGLTVFRVGGCSIKIKDCFY